MPCLLMRREKCNGRLLQGAPSPLAFACSCVNVSTTDATSGATALLLPAQKTHTLQLCTRNTHTSPDFAHSTSRKRFR